MNDMLAVILGGGAGTRLYPLTAHRSKPAVPLFGKYRLVDIPISNCINSGLNRIFVLTQYNSASLNRHISNSYQFDRFGHGFVNIQAAEQTTDSEKWFQGTADAVRQCLNHLRAFKHKHVLILSGDQLYQMDYSKMYDHHIESKAEITIATIPVNAEDATGFGILKTDKRQAVKEFHEKPSTDQLASLESEVSDKMKAAGRPYLASMGIYIFDRDVLIDVLQNHQDHTDFGKEVIPAAIGKRSVVSYPFEGYWSDIGTIKSFYDANLNLVSALPDFNLYSSEFPLYTNARMLPPTKVISSYVQNALIAEGAILENCTVSNCIIGLRSYIGHNAEVSDSIFMGSDYYRWHKRDARREAAGPDNPGIGEHSVIKKAIIDRNVSIGTNCRLTNDQKLMEAEGENYYIRDGIIIIPKNVAIPDNTII